MQQMVDETNWEGYSPDDFKDLNVSQNVKQLFNFISDYKPTAAEIDTPLKPFIPEYIPAVGEVDAFLKIPKPNKEEDMLGISMIDEPTLNQTKKSEMDYIIREFYMGDKTEVSKVHSIENAHKQPKEIISWIQTVEKMQDRKSAPSVIYSKKMPEMDTLLEAWDPEFEKAIAECEFPAADNDIPLEDYVKFALAMLDIPVHPGSDRNLIESLHLMFQLYSGLRKNQLIQPLEEQGDMHRLEC